MAHTAPRPRTRTETARSISGFLLCALLVTGPLAAQSQTITIIKNITKTVTKTVNVNGNGNVVGGTVVVGSITNNNNGGSTTNNGGNTGSGTGDPLIQAFDGSHFFFHGEPGKVYNMISDDEVFQVSALFKEANNAVHIGATRNGTYMQAIGFQQGGHRVHVETFADDSARIIVKVDDEVVTVKDMLSLKTERSLPLKDGSVINVTFSIFQERDGTVVTINTPQANFGISLVPPGLDHAGYWQPSYLNLNATLLTYPVGTLQGVIGDTFYYGADEQHTASTADSPESTVLPSHLAEILYPVFPDKVYELESVFHAPNVVFTGEFIREVIAQRKAIAHHMKWALSRTAVSK
eukprot:jgi/Botrbrau1/4341/Bobra.0232s0030.1